MQKARGQRPEPQSLRNQKVMGTKAKGLGSQAAKTLKAKS